MTNKRFCGNCGAEIAAEMTFCAQCGTRSLRPPTTTATQTPPAATVTAHNKTPLLLAAGIVIAVIAAAAIFLAGRDGDDAGPTKNVVLDELTFKIPQRWTAIRSPLRTVSAYVIGEGIDTYSFDLPKDSPLLRVEIDDSTYSLAELQVDVEDELYDWLYKSDSTRQVRFGKLRGHDKRGVEVDAERPEVLRVLMLRTDDEESRTYIIRYSVYQDLEAKNSAAFEAFLKSLTLTKIAN